MAMSKGQMFTNLFKNFLEINPSVISIIISDIEGLIIAGEKRANIDIELMSVLTTIVNPVLGKIRNEFAFKKFGSASFDTDLYRLLFLSVNEEITLTLVTDNLASIDRLSPYAYFLAEKSAQILNVEEGNIIQMTIPNFEYEGEEAERLKNQIYQMRLDTGGQYRFKFIIIGDHEVGKTSIVRRFVEKRFSADYRATIGINILTHSFKFIGNEVAVALWDIGAQQYFKRFRKTYYMGSQAAFIVFDLTNRETFNHLKVWLQELNEFIGKKDLPIVIVGNKSDLIDKRVISYQEGVQMAGDLGSLGEISKVSYIETSAKTGENIEDAFSLIAYHYITKSKETEEVKLQTSLLDQINGILKNKKKLILTFISETSFWSPGLQILTEIKQFGEFNKNLDTKEEKIYAYKNGLILNNFTYDKIRISDSDGVFCIFDARKKEHIDPKWKTMVVNIIEKVKENKVVLIGVRISDGINWSQLMEEFNVNSYLEKKMISLLFFKIGEEYRLEIYDQIGIMLNTIETLG